MALEIQGKKNNVYAPELQSSFRHKLLPGSYVVVPSTVDEGQEKAFLLRLFTSASLQNIRYQLQMRLCNVDKKFVEMIFYIKLINWSRHLE